METPTGPLCLPSYVGIAGGCDIDPKSQDYQPGLVAPKTSRLYHNEAKGTGAAAGGIVTSSGMLPPCEHVRMADCLDGTSYTMIVGEQSDWLLDQNRAKSQKYHGDPGWTVGGTGPGGGWLSGTTRVDPVPKLSTPGGPPAAWGADCWNITTVRYPPNFKRVMGAKPLPGCSENHGINNPLQSPHPGGLLVGFVDGSVQFISGRRTWLFCSGWQFGMTARSCGRWIDVSRPGVSHPPSSSLPVGDERKRVWYSPNSSSCRSAKERQWCE